MSQKYNAQVVRKIVEIGTNHEYSLLHIEKSGKICDKTGKARKREITLKHNSCGHIYTVPLYEFTDGKRRCGKCKGKVLREHFIESVESIKKKTHDMTDGEYAFHDNEYKGNKFRHNFFHKACNKPFKKSWDKFSNSGQRCTHCQKKGMESRASRHVRNILDHFNIQYIGEQRFSDCINPETGKLLPFDYYLPDINLIIEVDGEQHERGTFTNWDVSGVRKRDEIKNKYAKEKGIELVRIPTKEQRQLPNFLHAILSKELLKNLTLLEVSDVPHSSHPERIIADLKKVHNGEYALHDNFYHGVDTKHNFIHLTCGNIFKKTLQSLRTEKFPCPKCRESNIKRDKHDKSNKLLIDKSGGRYCLDDSRIGVDENRRRLLRCNRCKKSWCSTVGNIMKDSGGCPNCKCINDIAGWRKKYKIIVNALKGNKKLDKNQKQWVYWNKRKYTEGKLEKYRIRLLKNANLNLL